MAKRNRSNKRPMAQNTISSPTPARKPLLEVCRQVWNEQRAVVIALLTTLIVLLSMALPYPASLVFQLFILTLFVAYTAMKLAKGMKPNEETDKETECIESEKQQ